MLTTGEIKQINQTSTECTCSVYVPIFNNPGDQFEEILENVGVALPPGMDCGYKAGDKVIVAFLDNSYNSPSVVGKIVEGNAAALKAAQTNINLGFNCNSLIISDSASIPANTALTQKPNAEIIAPDMIPDSQAYTTIQEMINELVAQKTTITNQIAEIAMLQTEVTQLKTEVEALKNKGSK